MDILVATILSAQCTDERVNRVTVSLFRKYRTPADYAKADVGEFESEIRSTGFFHSKAKNIIGAAKMILDEYGGKVPDTMDELTELPGVARKTANIVLGNAYGKVEGIAVDTHVRRVSYRLGMTDSDKPEIIEQDLMGSVSRKDWFRMSNMLIKHGRKICIARKPLCGNCFLNDLCPSLPA